MKTASKRLEGILPEDTDAEQAVLGSMMLDNKAIFAAGEILAEPDFYRPIHGVIFRCMRKLNAQDVPVDLMTLKDELIRIDMIDAVGGVEYLMALISQVPSAARVEHYARIVEDKAILRKIDHVGSEIKSLAYSGFTGEEAMQRVTKLTLELRQTRKNKRLMWMSDAIQSAWDALQDRMTAGGVQPVIRFGIDKLDWQTLGPQAGQLTLIGARPSQGKTSLLFEIIRHTKIGPFLIFSVETGDRSLSNRFISTESGVDLYRIRRGILNDTEINNVTRAVNNLYNMRVLLHVGEISINDLVATTKMAMLEHDIKGVMIDYGQLIKAPGDEYERGTHISQELKNLATTHDLPVIVAVQLNRESAKRKKDDGATAEPQMIDIKGTGQWEQDADLGVLIHNPQSEGATGPVPAKLLYRKQKDGGTGSAECVWDPRSLRFYDIETNQTEEQRVYRGGD